MQETINRIFWENEWIFKIMDAFFCCSKMHMRLTTATILNMQPVSFNTFTVVAIAQFPIISLSQKEPPDQWAATAQPLWPTVCFICPSSCLPLPDATKGWIHTYVAFRGWLLSHSFVSVRFIRAVALAELCSFLWPSDVPCCAYPLICWWILDLFLTW